MNNAIGAITITSAGMLSAVTPRKVSSDWPLVVSRSNSRSACVIQMTEVKPPRLTRNAEREIRKM